MDGSFIVYFTYLYSSSFDKKSFFIDEEEELRGPPDFGLTTELGREAMKACTTATAVLWAH